MANDRSSRSTDSEDSEDFFRDLEEFFGQIDASLESVDFMSNLRALSSRTIQLVLRPEQLAPLILDFFSLPLSMWSGRQSGPDFLYPLSCLKKQKSGRLAKLLLEHGRDLQQRNLHVATSPMDGVDPPRVAVIDLNEVSPEVIKRGYTVPADFYGHVVMVMYLQILVTLLLQMFVPTDCNLLLNWYGDSTTFVSGGWLGGWNRYFAGISCAPFPIWFGTFCIIAIIYGFAALRGEGTLTLVRRSHISAPGSALLLDHDFVVVLVGAQSVVEAISESNFGVSHTVPWKFHLRGRELLRYLCYEALEATCQGLPFFALTGFWLLLLSPSTWMAYVPLGPTFVVMLAAHFTPSYHLTTRIVQAKEPELYLGKFLRTIVIAGVRSVFSIVPSSYTISLYTFAASKVPSPWSAFDNAWLLFAMPLLFLVLLLVSSRNYYVRTAKLLDVLGHPPVRRWEFDTLAAAATFQCLVVCRGVPRPVKSIDVLTLLDALVPDERDVWRVWKERVADRVTHEVEVSFAPTLPSFGDQRKKHLKELLDQAQVGYWAYTNFYDRSAS